MKLTSLDFLVIVGYLIGLSAIGLYYGKRQTSRDEYFLGGRQVHWLLAGGSIMATLLSTATYLFVPGEMVRYGITYFVGLLALPLVIPVVTRVIVPVLLDLRITSAYEYLERRFSKGVRTLAAVVFVIRTFMWMGIVIYTASLAITEVTGWNVYVTILLTGSVTTIYTAVGGFRTVIWTDNLQLLILLGGALVIPIVIGVSTGTGLPSWWSAFSDAGRTTTLAFSFDLTVRTTLVAVVLGQFFWSICTNAGDQVVVQRYLSTPSLSSARKSVWVFTILQIILVAGLAVVGLALFAANWQASGLPVQEFQDQIAPRADRLLPRFIAEGLPAGLSGLLLAALLAAAMSSLSSAINSISTVAAVDLTRQPRTAVAEGGGLERERAISLLAGIMGLAMACAVAFVATRTTWNLLELSLRVGHLFVGPLAVLFFAGILFNRVGTPAALWGFAVSTGLSVFICFGKELFGLERSISFVWIVTLPFLLGLAAAALLGPWLATPTAPQVRDLTMRGLAAARLARAAQNERGSTSARQASELPAAGER